MCETGASDRTVNGEIWNSRRREGGMWCLAHLCDEPMRGTTVEDGVYESEAYRFLCSYRQSHANKQSRVTPSVRSNLCS